MPKAKRARKALVAAEALNILAGLASPGAYVAATASGSEAAERLSIYSPSNGFARPISEASRAAMAYCLRMGWVTPEPCGTRLRISATGARALRTTTQGGERRAQPSASQPRQPRAGRQQGSESALAWLRSRKDKEGRRLVTEVQFKAGEQLAADFWHAQLSPRVTANWSDMTPGSRMPRATPGLGVDVRDAVISARRRFQRALDAVGPELAGILVNVCCQDMGLETAGQAAGWPQRAARVVLDLALTRLARHYGMIAPERPIATGLRHWGDADYRPTLETWR